MVVYYLQMVSHFFLISNCCDGVGYLLYLFHDLLSIRQLVNQRLDDLEQWFGL